MTYILNFNVSSVITHLKQDKIPRFYAIMVLLSIVGFLLNYHLWQLDYLILTCFGAGFWIISLLIVNRLKLITEQVDPEKLRRTVTLFFLLNAGVSLFNLLQIVLITKSNPYTFTGMDLKYHTSTGDSITGLLFDFSSTNAIINIFGIFYFLFNRSYLISFLCLVVSLLTTSNTNTILLIAILFLMILFSRGRFYRTIGLCYIATIVVFFARVSPSNVEYVTKELAMTKEQLPASRTGGPEKHVLTPEEIKEKQRQVFQRYYVSKLPKNQKHSKANDSSIRKALSKIEIREKARSNTADPKFEKEMKTKRDRLAQDIKFFYNDTVVPMQEFSGKHYPGKLMSVIQTLKYSVSGVKPFLLGAGTGMFSSKTAFKASGMGIFGKYPEKFEYVSATFRDNNLKVYCYFFNMPLSKHSVTNTPFSSYNQLLGEYGYIGVFCFLFFYVWFFLKRFKQLSYGRYLLPLCLLFLIFDYWFEHLSILIIFELMMLMDLKTNSNLSKNVSNPNE